MYDYQSVRQVVAADQSFCTQYYAMALGNGNDRTPEPIMVWAPVVHVFLKMVKSGIRLSQCEPRLNVLSVFHLD